jgi:hypothetical protein
MKSYAEYEAGYYRESLLVYVYTAFKTTIKTEVRTTIMEMWSFFMYSPFVQKEVNVSLRTVGVNSTVHQFLTNYSFWSMLWLTKIRLASTCASVMSMYQEM